MDSEPENSKGIRRMLVDNYSVFYVIKEDRVIVTDAGSGFPTILDTWEKEGWVKPELIEDTDLNQVTLVLKMVKEGKEQEETYFVQKNERSFSEEGF